MTGIEKGKRNHYPAFINSSACGSTPQTQEYSWFEYFFLYSRTCSTALLGFAGGVVGGYSEALQKKKKLHISDSAESPRF